MLEQIKKISKRTGEAATPARFLFGEVSKLKPLTVQVEELLPISAPALVVLKGAGFSVGDKVILLRDYGGQRYLILGCV